MKFCIRSVSRDHGIWRSSMTFIGWLDIRKRSIDFVSVSEDSMKTWHYCRSFLVSFSFRTLYAIDVYDFKTQTFYCRRKCFQYRYSPKFQFVKSRKLSDLCYKIYEKVDKLKCRWMRIFQNRLTLGRTRGWGGGGAVDAALLRFFKILSWGFSLHISPFQ